MPSNSVDQLLSGLVSTCTSLADFAHICIKSAAIQRAFDNMNIERQRRETAKRESQQEKQNKKNEEAKRAVAATKLGTTPSKVDLSQHQSLMTVHPINQIEDEEEMSQCQLTFDLQYDLRRNEEAVNTECRRSKRIIYELRATRFTSPEKNILITTDSMTKYRIFKNKIKRLYEMETNSDYEINELRPILLQMKQLEGDFDLLFCELEYTDKVKNTFNISPVTSDILSNMQTIIQMLRHMANVISKKDSPMVEYGLNKDAELIKYEIHIYTGTEGLEGTDIKDYPLLLKLYSDKNESRLFNICESASNIPGSSQMNTYTFYSPDIGSLTALGIFHHDKHFKSWDLRNIEVIDEKKGIVSFPVETMIKADENGDLEMYVAKNRGVMKEKPIVKGTKAADKRKGNYTYTVEIKTLKGRLGSSNKLITLFKGGTKTIGGSIDFSDGKSRFSPKTPDLFNVRWPTIPTVDFIEVYVRGPQDVPWYCDSITLTDLINDKTYFFPIIGPVDIERIRIQAQGARRPGATSYQIKVRTGSKNTIGFEAVNVHVQLASDVTVSDQLHLKNPVSKSKKLFQRDSTDVFVFNNIRSVGEIQIAKLWHDGDSGDAWYCEDLVVTDLDTNQEYHFPVNRWLGLKKQDGLVSVDLQVGVLPDQQSSSKVKQTPDEKSQQSDTERPNSGYKVIVQTGDEGVLGFTGTDAPITLTLIHDKKQSLKLLLKNSKTNKNAFERGNTDVFFFEDKKSIGDIKSAQLEMDGKAKDGWFCEHIQVEDIVKNKIYRFPVNRWLDKNQYDKQTSIQIVPDVEPGYKSKNNAESSQITKGYIIKIKTGSKSSSQFNGNVNVRLINNKKASVPLKLLRSTTNDRPFQTGKTDEFQFGDVKSVGKLERAVLNISSTEDSWFCEQMTVTDVKDNYTYTFPVNRWIDNQKYDQMSFVNLVANQEPGYLPFGNTISKYHVSSDENNTIFNFRIKTKEFTCQNAMVVVNLIGSSKRINGLCLTQSDNPSPFQKKQTDAFVLYAPDVGDVKEIELLHTGDEKCSLSLDYVEFATGLNPSKWKKYSVKGSININSSDGCNLVVLK